MRAFPRILRSCAPMPAQMVEGLQGRAGTKEFLGAGHVIATAKHFVGDGGTAGGKDQGDNPSLPEQLRDIHGAGYPPAIEAGVQAVMASFSSVRGAEAARRPRTADRGAEARHGFRRPRRRRLERARPGAGLHQHQLRRGDQRRPRHVHGARQLEGLLREHAGAGAIGRDSDGAARRGGAAHPAGEAARGACSTRARPRGGRYAGHFELLGAPEHRAVARAGGARIARAAQERRQLLPLSPKLNVLVAGDGADNIPKQAGGWTISWQGTGLPTPTSRTPSRSGAGIDEAVKAAGGNATLSVDGSFTAKPDVGDRRVRRGPLCRIRRRPAARSNISPATEATSTC